MKNNGFKNGKLSNCNQPLYYYPFFSPNLLKNLNKSHISLVPIFMDLSYDNSLIARSENALYKFNRPLAMNTFAKSTLNYYYSKNKEEEFPEKPDDKVKQVS